MITYTHLHAACLAMKEKNHPSFRTSRALRGLCRAKIKSSSSKEEKTPHTFYEMQKPQIILAQGSSPRAKYDYCECMQINNFNITITA